MNPREETKKEITEKFDEIEKLIDFALAEDIRSGDLTTLALIPPSAQISARFILKQGGIVAGLPFVEMIFKKIDPQVTLTPQITEGMFLKAGTVIATISGPAQAIFSGERLALNLLQHLSGIATITKAYVKKVAGLKCAIMDTRKTLPGLRALEKYAVKIGGGINHRFGLDDRLVIKKNHLSFLSTHSPHAINEAIQKVKDKSKGLPIEIEINDIALLERILHTDIVAIMLSKMMPDEILKCVSKIRRTNKKVYVESSGAITLDTVRAYGETGVDGVCISYLTYSVQALDIGLRLV